MGGDLAGQFAVGDKLRNRYAVERESGTVLQNLKPYGLSRYVFSLMILIDKLNLPHFATPGCSVTLIAKDERYARLKAHGLTVNGAHFPIAVTHPDHASAPADLIIVALKHRHLP